MTFDELVQLAIDNWIITVVSITVLIFFVIRVYKTIRIHLGAKSYVRKSKKMRKKKFNGIQLIDNIHKKRKKGTNSYHKLKGRGKKKVKKYFNYKIDELPIITRYSYGKLFKRSSDKLIIFARNDKKIVKKVSLKKGLKNLIDLVDRYECLDEMIHFLHNLPGAILEQQDYDVYINDQDITIGYKIS